jgi:hypothetical protein
MNANPPSPINRAGFRSPVNGSWWRLALGMNLVWMTGCRAAPSINLLGSFFPGWMLCMFLGVLGALVGRLIFIKTNIHPHLPFRAFIYFCLWVLITLATWLLFFRS